MALEGWFDTTLVDADWFPIDLNGWFDETLVSKPSGPATHSTTGSLTGQIGAVTGSSARFHAFASTGALIASAANVAGSAARAGAFVTHDTSGALTGQGASVSGASSRFRAFSTSGTLTGASSTVAGAASSATTRPSTGALTGQIGSVAGSASRFHAFSTTGSLTGQSSSVSGDASRSGAAVSHDTTGALSGQESGLSGVALRANQANENNWLGGGYDFLNPEKHHKPIPKKVRKLARYIAKKIVEDEPEKPVDALQRDVIAELKAEMANRQQEWQAFYSIYIETLIIQARAQLIEKALQDEEDEAIVRLLFDFM